MIVCYLGLGSNLKTPERLIRQSIVRLKKIPKTRLAQIASLYFTLPWGVLAQPPFCNTVIKIQTTLSPEALLTSCQQIEKEFGRVRKKRWGPRTLDIDILLYGNIKYNTSRLTIPHPYLLEREFVIQPLLELLKQKSEKNLFSS